MQIFYQYTETRSFVHHILEMRIDLDNNLAHVSFQNACITHVICGAIVYSTSLSWDASSIIKQSNGAAKFMQLFPEDDRV